MQETYTETIDPEAVEAVIEAPPPLSEEEIVNQVIDRFNRALDASDPIRRVWDANYEAFNGKYDLGPKLKHQSKICLPLVSRSVLYKAGRLKAALVSGTETFYAIEGQTEEAEIVAPIHQALIDANLEAEDFPAKLEANTVAGELTSGQAWVAYPDASGGWPCYTRLEPVDMRTLLRDPTGRGKFHVQCRTVDATDLEAMAQKSAWNMDRVREIVAVEATRDPKLNTAIEQASRMVTMDTQDNRRKSAVLYEYWGPLHRSDGSLDAAMSYVVIGNGSRLLHRDDDPHGDGRDVYVDSDLLPNPFGVYAKTDIEDSVGLATFINRLLNAMIDGAAFDVHRAFITDSTRIRNLADVTAGIGPGTVIDQDGSPSADPAIAPLNVGHLPTELFALYQAARQEFEAGTEVTDMTRGLPQQKGTKDQTATEFMGKTEAASRSLDALSKSVEEKVLEPLLQRMVYYQGRYFDPLHPRIKRLAGAQIEEAANRLVALFGERGEAIDAAVALELIPVFLAEPFTVRVRGISGVLAREGQIAKLAAFVDQAIKLEAGMMLDVPSILERFAHLSGTDPKDALLDEGDQMWMQQMIQQAAQQLAMQYVQQYAGQMRPAGQNPAQGPQEGVTDV